MAAEYTGSYGAAITRTLLGAGYVVVEVNRTNRFDRRSGCLYIPSTPPFRCGSVVEAEDVVDYLALVGPGADCRRGHRVFRARTDHESRLGVVLV